MRLVFSPQLLVHFAASEGQLGLMETLGSKGCKLDELNPEGLAPLHIAAMRGDSAMVRSKLLNSSNVHDIYHKCLSVNPLPLNTG